MKPSPTPACRICSSPLNEVMCDLGMSPVANSYVPFTEPDSREARHPLKVFVCGKCLLCQVEALEKPEAIFSDYAYFSSFSSSWVEHAREYCAMMVSRFGLGPRSMVVEVASNDGYLLQHFRAAGIPVLGVEPAANVAEAAMRLRGIPSLVRFFGKDTARHLAEQGVLADLVVGNNVFAHVPDLHDFTAGLRTILRPEGVLTLEFPHVRRLIEGNQFDTIYHEHFSYLSLLSAEVILSAHGLRIFDVEELPTHGGSLRIFACHEEARSPLLATTDRVRTVRDGEIAAGFSSLDTYRAFDDKVRHTCEEVRSFLESVHHDGKSVAAYGAAAKGVTLLNCCGIGSDLVEYAVDRNPAKQNHWIPGVRIPVHPPEKIFETKPDYLLILPWNLEEEIRREMEPAREWGCRFVVPIPEICVTP